MGIQIWFHICKWTILIFKNHLHSGLTRIGSKTIRVWSKWAIECLNVTSTREPTCISQMAIQKLFCIFKPIIPLPPNSLLSGLVKLGPKMTQSWEKGAQELHVFSLNRDNVYNSQMGNQLWFHLWKWRICVFKNNLHSGLTRINPKPIRISRNQYHMYNSQMGIQIWFHIWKWRIYLFKNHLHSGLTIINPKTVRIYIFKP